MTKIFNSLSPKHLKSSVMFKQIFCLIFAFALFSTSFVNAALTNVGDAAVINENKIASTVTGNPESGNPIKPLGNGKKGEWRRRKFPKPAAEPKNFDDHADADINMDKRSFYGDYGYYYYWCG